jgi:phosphoribosyl 1,2-cyclic phosphodiesterase
MYLKIIGSNSSGNAYILQAADGYNLLIDCGVHITKIKKALNFSLARTACIVTHAHGDHAFAIKDVLQCGLPVYASKETFDLKGIHHHRAFTIDASRSIKHGNFKIKAFELEHDVHCYGFLIDHPESGLILFLTDTMYCKYVFPKLNNIIVECNHDLEIMESNGTQQFLKDRVVQSHMNVNVTKDLLLANDLSGVNNIVLIHLSDRNSNAAEFKKTISAATGKDVTIAEAGITMEFNKSAI